MQSLDPALKRQFHTDGYIVLEGLLSAEELDLFNAELDRIRTIPGYEPDSDPRFNIGHYSVRLDLCVIADPSEQSVAYACCAT